MKRLSELSVRKIICTLGAWLVVVSPAVALAADGTTGPTLANPLKSTFLSIPCLILGILQIATKLGSYFLVVMIVWLGFSFVMAQGNPVKLKQVREAFVWTMVGAFIVLGTFVISQVIQDTVGQFGATPAGSTQTVNSCQTN